MQAFKKPQQLLQTAVGHTGVGFFLGVIIGGVLGITTHMAITTGRAAAPAAVEVPALKAAAGEMVQVNSLMRNWNVDAGFIFDSILNAHPSPANATVLEVGCFDGTQCWAAANAGYGRVLCVEPAPANHARVKNALAGMLDSGRVQLLQKAAYNESGKMVEFSTGGSVFDHIGNMTDFELRHGLKPGNIVMVETIAIDDLFNDTDVVYLAKLDTQGFDGVVLQGMRRMLMSHRVRVLMIELWPKAMARLTGCEAALSLLWEAGYTLYEMRVEGSGGEWPSKTERFYRPTSIKGLCDWYLREWTEFGIWNDVLATVEPLLGAAPAVHLAA